MAQLKRSVLGVTVLLAGVLAFPGCAAQEKKKDPGEKNVATAHWRAARGAVMATLANDQYKAGNFTDARNTVTEALKFAPDSVELRVLSARIAIEQNNLDLAESELLHAAKVDPKAPAPDYYYGVLMQRWQRLPRALELYTSASEKAPREPAFILARAETLVALERPDEAMALLTAAAREFDTSAEIRSALGQLFMRDRQYAKACEQLRQAVMLAADDEALREVYARALFKAERFDEATVVFERLTRSEKNQDRADLFSLLGECYMNAERFTDARAAFETAVNLQPQNPQYLLNLGKAALESKDLRRADLTIRKALAMRPSDPQANLLLGYVRMEQGKYAEALAAFRRAAQGDMKDTIALCMSGLALEKLGRSDEAVRAYAEALSLRPDDELARGLLGKLQARKDGVADLNAGDR